MTLLKTLKISILQKNQRNSKTFNLIFKKNQAIFFKNQPDFLKFRLIYAKMSNILPLFNVIFGVKKDTLYVYVG